MKRCPQCNRVETDEALKFCRVDGTTLVSDSSAIGAEAGTAQLGVDAGEVHTSILPHRTVAEMSRATGPTTALPLQTPAPTGALTQPKSRKAIAIVVVLTALFASVAAIAVNSYLSRKSATAIESIAVMPFVNESGNQDLDYLSDGITETLIKSLSQLPNLNVKARSSVFRYKGKVTDSKTIGTELGVQAILNGRVVQRGDQLTLSLELVDTKTENVVWSEQYNRNQGDLVKLQTEIARDVSQKLRTKLSSVDEQKLAKNYTENTEAYKLYLQGRFYWNKRTPQDIQKSVAYFRQATTLDPNYALGYAGLADAYSYLSIYGATQPHETMPKAKEAALKALSLDDNLAEAHAALCQPLMSYDFDFAGAERECKRAIELNPNYPTAHHYFAILLSWVGRHEESIAERKRVLEIDPLSVLAHRSYGDTLIMARRYDDGIAQLKKTLEMDAGYASVYAPLSVGYQMKGDYAASVEALAKYHEMAGDPSGAAQMREGYAKGGWQGFLRTVVDKKIRINSPWHSADVFHAALGEKDKAFAALNKAYENRELGAAAIKSDPRFDSLRDDPRFAALLKRVGFPQ